MTKKHKYEIGQLVDYCGTDDRFKGVRVYIVGKEIFTTKIGLKVKNEEICYYVFARQVDNKTLSLMKEHGVGLSIIHEDDIIPVSASWLEKLTKAVKLRLNNNH